MCDAFHQGEKCQQTMRKSNEGRRKMRLEVRNKGEIREEGKLMKLKVRSTRKRQEQQKYDVYIVLLMYVCAGPVA